MEEATEYKKYLEALRKATEEGKKNKKINQLSQNKCLVEAWVSLLKAEILKE